tara:strand:- start:3173 stop:3901 length:729 start_codon:yes stop_codon:yes gene_type:complete
MIDIHNHVLPNIDDGSKSIEMSLNMLKCAHNQGVTDVVNTVHFQHPLFLNIDHSLENLERTAKSLQLKLDECEIPIKIHLGSEVFYHENLLKIRNEPLITMGGGKFMLIEFPPKNIPNSQKQILFDLKMSGITPIIAHPERYKLVQENFNIIYDWINAGCLIQVDAGSLLGLLGERAKKSSILIIKEKCCHILASDAHNDSNRNFCIKDAYNFVKNIVGKKNGDLLVYEYPSSIIKGEDLYF